MTNNSPWGLDQLDNESKEYQEEQNKIQSEIINFYQKTFNTANGKKVLEHLKKCTLDQPTWVPLGKDGASSEQYAFVREGQNSIVREILDKINTKTNNNSNK